MWAIVKKALNGTVGVKTKTLDQITREESYRNYYRLYRMAAASDLSILAFDEGVTEPSTSGLIYSQKVGYKTVIFPVSTSKIGKNVFEDFSGMDFLFLPPNLKFIDDYAFLNCSELKSISIPNSVNRLGIGVFSGCDKLRSISISGRIGANMNGSLTGVGLYGVDIYVPWGEDDEEMNRAAPWGAVNATIHYNSEV